MAITENLPQDERSSQRDGRVLILCSDLFFGTQVTGLVREAGYESSLELTPARAIGQLHDADVVGIVIDLEAAGLDLPALISALPAEPRPRVIAFAPHVHTQRLEAARQAGCDAVLTRGQISSSSAVVRKALAGNPKTHELEGLS